MFSSGAGASVIDHAYHSFLTSHTTVASPRLGNATSRIAAAAAAVIAITIAAIATVTTAAKAPRTDGCSPQDGNNCAAGGSGGRGMPCGAMRKGSCDVRGWHFGMEWVSSFWAVLYSFVMIHLFYCSIQVI